MNEDEICSIEGVPVSPLLAEDRVNRYGSVVGLDDEELASPEELERQVFLEQWESVLALPVRGRRNSIQPHIDEYFGVDWGAFATVDFSRSMPEFDKARYKADKLREELRYVIIVMQTLSGRLPRARRQVLKYLQRGVIELGHIESLDMYELARLDLRARRLQKQIQQLKNVSWAKARKELAEVLR